MSLATRTSSQGIQLSAYVTSFCRYCDGIDQIINQQMETLQTHVDQISQKTPKTSFSCWSCFSFYFSKPREYEHLESSSPRIEFRKFLHEELNYYEKVYPIAQRIVHLRNQATQYLELVKTTHTNLRSLTSSSYSSSHPQAALKKIGEKLEPFQAPFLLADKQVSKRIDATGQKIDSFLSNLCKLNQCLDSAFACLKKENPSLHSRKIHFPQRVFSVNNVYYLNSSLHPHLQEALDLPREGEKNEEEEKIESCDDPFQKLQDEMNESETSLKAQIEEIQKSAYEIKISSKR